MTVRKKFMPSARSLEAFIVAAESSSFEQAASRLGRTKTAFSEQIKRLEEHVGMPLFVRGRHVSPTLTREGQRYYSQVRKAVATLAPALSNDQSPVIHEYSNFDETLAESDPALQKFWAAARERDFDFRADGSGAGVYLRSVSLSFRQFDGQWVYNHIGRQAAHARAMGSDYVSQVIGKPAAVGKPSGRFSAYDYEVTKIYNRVAVTKQPAISDIEAHVPLPDGRTIHTAYRRIVVPGFDENGPIVVVHAVLHKHPPLALMQDAGIRNCPLTLLESTGALLRNYLSCWQRDKFWDGDKLAPFHDHSLVCTPRTDQQALMLVAAIGKQHASVREFGKTWRWRQLGRLIDDADDDTTDYDAQTAVGYYETLKKGEPRLDLIHTFGVLPQGNRVGLVYFRLLTCAYLNDGTPIVASIAHVVDRVNTKHEAIQLVDELLSRDG